MLMVLLGLYLFWYLRLPSFFSFECNLRVSAQALQVSFIPGLYFWGFLPIFTGKAKRKKKKQTSGKTKKKRLEGMFSHRVAKGNRGLCTASWFLLLCQPRLLDAMGAFFCRPVCWRHSAFTYTSSSTQGTWTFVIALGASQNATKFQLKKNLCLQKMKLRSQPQGGIELTWVEMTMKWPLFWPNWPSTLRRLAIGLVRSLFNILPRCC